MAKNHGKTGCSGYPATMLSVTIGGSIAESGVQVHASGRLAGKNHVRFDSTLTWPILRPARVSRLP